MIAVAKGNQVARLVDRVCTQTERYSQIIICSPFIDTAMLARLEGLVARVAKSRSALRILTTPMVAGELVTNTRIGTCNRVSILGCAALHAKFYIALGRPGVHTEAIVTSANLTCAGTVSNIELGMFIDSSTETGRRVLREINHFAKNLAA